MINTRAIDFFIIGTQKAGTTSLYNYLIQHPDIYFSEVKELRYFIDAEIYSRGEKYLDAFFYKHKGQKLIGSSHVHMLPCKEAPGRVFKNNPKAKFIIMLRDPISRARSAYDYAVKNGWEPKARSLYEAYAIEHERLNAYPVNYDLLYFSNGLYETHLENWIKHFPKEQFLILTDSELKRQPQEVLDKIFKFLEIEPAAIDFSKEYNVKSYTRYPALQKMLLSRSGYKKTIGKLLPTKLSVWIRSVLFKKMVNLNSVPVKEDIKKDISQKTVEKTEEHIDEYKNFFENDLKALSEKYNIDFIKK